MAEAILVPAPVIPDDAPPANPPANPAPTNPTPPVNPPTDPPVSFDPPAPVVPPAPQDAVVVYEKTGDVGLDLALRYVGERGLGPEHPAVQAATKGDFGALEQTLSALGDKAKDFKEYLALAKDAYGRRQAAAKQNAEAAAKVVYDAVGGKEQWAAIQPWVAANADEAEKASINAAFKAGGLAAATMAKHLRDLYAAHGKSAPKSAVKPDASARPPQGDEPLSARDYGQAVKALYAKLGAHMQGSSEYAQLQARRNAGRR